VRKIGLLLLLSISVARAEVVDRIIALVNSEVVTESDLRAFNKKVGQNGMLDDLLLFGAGAESLQKSKQAQLNYVINEKLLESEIKKLNLSVTIEKVEQEIRDIAKRNRVSRAELLEAIKSQGMSASEYQDFIKNRIERQSLIEQEVSSKVRVSDEDALAKYMSDHPGSSEGIFEYTLSHILFNPKKGGLEKAKDRANLALSKLIAGENFDAVAEQFSEDPDFTSGGLLGSFKAGEFSKEMEVAVQNLKPGEVSNVVNSKGSLHILRLVSKKLISDPHFEKEKEKIRSSLFEVSFKKNFRVWLELKRDAAFVRINSSEYK
jgi:peptidyl-prolyl cis-trans isomerase SurA